MWAAFDFLRDSDTNRMVIVAVEMLSGGAGIVLVAGTAAMDPLDPAFEAVRLLKGRVERVGARADAAVDEHDVTLRGECAACRN